MTVAELITALQAMPQDAPVLYDIDSFQVPVERVEAVRLVADWENESALDAERADGPVTGVRIV